MITIARNRLFFFFYLCLVLFGIWELFCHKHFLYLYTNINMWSQRVLDSQFTFLPCKCTLIEVVFIHPSWFCPLNLLLASTNMISTLFEISTYGNFISLVRHLLKIMYERANAGLRNLNMISMRCTHGIKLPLSRYFSKIAAIVLNVETLKVNKDLFTRYTFPEWSQETWGNKHYLRIACFLLILPDEVYNG